MRTYIVRYVCDFGNIKTHTIKVERPIQLASAIVEQITDMADNNSDNIISVTEIK